MQLQSKQRQNLGSQEHNHDQDNLECRQTLSRPLSQHSQHNVKTCGCRCTCSREQHQQNPAQRRKQKRKQAKRRNKEREKQFIEQSQRDLQTMIRNIYGLKGTFQEYQWNIQICLGVATDHDRLGEAINAVIREQIELIRKEIIDAINALDQLPEGEQHAVVEAFFSPIRKIVVASTEMEEVINFYLTKFLLEGYQEPPMQRNLDRTTIRVMLKADLYQTAKFSRLCSYIFKAPLEMYIKERELINLMMTAFENSNDPGISARLGFSDSQEDTEEYVDNQDEEWEEEGSTIESSKNSANQRSRRRRKGRRRKQQNDFEISEESIIKRIQQIKVVQEDRSPCNVRQEWLHRISKRKQGFGELKS